MDAKPQQPKARDGVVPTLDVAIGVVNLAKDISGIAPAQAAFGCVSTLLTMIRVTFPSSAARYLRFTHSQDSVVNERDYIDLGLSCADVCQALDRGLKGKRSDELGKSVLEAIQRLTA